MEAYCDALKATYYEFQPNCQKIVSHTQNQQATKMCEATKLDAASPMRLSALTKLVQNWFKDF